MTDSISGFHRTTARLLATLCVLALFSIVAAAQPTARPAQPYFTEPALAPDGSEIAFISGGDVWTVAANGGEAHLLVSHPATESRPLYSPDGRRLAFGSARTGNGDIYILTIESGDLKRLTFDDSNDQLDAWSEDGRWIYFSSNSRDNGGTDIFRVSVDGGTPMQVVADQYTTEYFSAPKRDGSASGFHRAWLWRLAVVAQGPQPHRRKRDLADAVRSAIQL